MWLGRLPTALKAPLAVFETTLRHATKCRTPDEHRKGRRVLNIVHREGSLWRPGGKSPPLYLPRPVGRNDDLCGRCVLPSLLVNSTDDLVKNLLVPYGNLRELELPTFVCVGPSREPEICPELLLRAAGLFKLESHMPT